MRLRSLRLALALVLLAPAVAPAQSPPPARTYVIVHGAWGGSWAFRQVDSLLTAAGHRVYRPSLTGLGERVHLASAEVDLGTHVRDVINVLLYEGLDDVVLVGHSYGGMVISGVADRVPERIAHLVYLDAFVPEDGESVLGIVGDEAAARFREWTRDGLVVPPWVRADQPPPHDVPHPLRTFSEPIRLTNPAARRVPATYILTVDAGAEEDDFARHAQRAGARGWAVQRMTADHNPQWSAPRELAERLLAVPAR